MDCWSETAKHVERNADRAMPHAQDTRSYREFRKLEVYKATVESFLVDGTLTPRERAALDRLRGKLGISAASAAALEGDAGLQGRTVVDMPGPARKAV